MGPECSVNELTTNLKLAELVRAQQRREESKLNFIPPFLEAPNCTKSPEHSLNLGVSKISWYFLKYHKMITVLTPFIVKFWICYSNMCTGTAMLPCEGCLRKELLKLA